MTDVSHSEDRIDIGEETVELPASVKQSVEIGGVVVVRLEASERIATGRNVWAFVKDGTRLWDIELAGEKGGKHYRYTNIWVEEGNLWAYNWNGLAYHVDIETGELLERRQMK